MINISRSLCKYISSFIILNNLDLCLASAIYFLLLYKKVEDSGGSWKITSTLNTLNIRLYHYVWRFLGSFKLLGNFYILTNLLRNKKLSIKKSIRHVISS